MTRDINDILDKCIEDILSGQKTVEDCLQLHRDSREELEPMLCAATRLLEAGSIAPNPTRKQEARDRFIAAVEQKRWEAGVERQAILGDPKGRAGFLSTSFARLGAIAVIFAMMGGTTLALAKGSLPGSPFYPIKLAVEKARIGLVKDEKTRRKLYVTAAEARVTEIKKIKSENAYYTELVKEIANNFDKAEQVKVDNKDAKSADDLNNVVRDNKEVLEDILEKAPPVAKPPIERALETTKQRELSTIDKEQEEAKPQKSNAIKNQPTTSTKKSNGKSSGKRKTSSSGKVKVKGSSTFQQIPSNHKPDTNNKQTNNNEQEHKN